MVHPTHASMGFSVLPGFAPAGEALLFRQKAPKPVTPRLALLEGTDASLRRADQLAPLKQGPPPDKSVPPVGQTAGVGPWDLWALPAMKVVKNSGCCHPANHRVDEIGRTRKILPTRNACRLLKDILVYGPWMRDSCQRQAWMTSKG